MNTKILSFVFAFFLSAVLLGGIASAYSSLDLPLSIISKPNSVLHNSGSFQIVFNASFVTSGPAGDNATITFSSPSNPQISSATFAPASALFNDGDTKTITATISYPAFQTGAISGTITASDSTKTGLSNSLAFSIPINNTASLSDIVKTQELSRTQNGTFNLFNNGNVPLNLALNSTGAFNVNLYEGTSTTIINSLTISPNTTKTLRVVPTTIPTLSFGSNAATITANDAGNNVSKSVQFSITEGFCKPAIGTNLSLNDIEITNDGEGDDNEWLLLDNVRVRVDVDNDGPNDIDDIFVKLGLFDSSGKNVVGKLEFSTDDEEEIELGDIDSGDDDRATFEFKVPGDLSTGTYKLVFKTFSKDEGESTLCVDSMSSIETIKINNQDDSGKFIGFDNIKVSPTQATCGDSVALDFDAVNVGEDDEDQVRVKLYNRELALDQSIEIKQGLDRGDSKLLSFTFQIPSSATDKNYNLELLADYDYRNGNYDESLDSPTIVPLKVFGCAPSTETTIASITPSLQSDAKPGEDLLISAVIRNTGSSSMTYTIDVKGYSDWAKLNSITDRLISLSAGESKTIQLSLLPNADASGENSLTLELRSGDKVQSSQMKVNFPEKESSFAKSLRENKLAWVIGLVNVILVILIIIVAVKLSRS